MHLGCLQGTALLSSGTVWAWASQLRAYQVHTGPQGLP